MAVPAATPVTTPEGLTVATFESEEPHCADDVRSCVLPSEYVPMALSDAVAETNTEAELGETETVVKVGLPEPLGVFCIPLHDTSSTDAKLKIQIALMRRTNTPSRESLAS
jgi:hypothetical protein